MESEESLDDMLNSQVSDGVNLQSASEASDMTVSRPKLRKIKRAKVRPLAEAPTIPEKLMPEETNQQVVETNQDAFTSQFNVSTDQQTQITPDTTGLQTEDVISQIPENLSDDNEEIGTAIMTSKEAQDIAASNDTLNGSFALDNLPPELDYIEDDEDADSLLDETDYIKKKIMYIAAGACFLVGLFIGKAFFSSSKIENRGLEGIVTNPDIPAGRPRCGLTDKSQACIFYVMNWYKQELNGRDFYKLAAQLTGREEYMIETDNLRYANVKIKPGHFAQLNIPAIK